MSLDLTILPSASSLEGLVRSPSALSSARLKPFVAGDRERVTLRLVDDLGQVIDPTGYVFRVGLGPINRHPTDGSLDIHDGSDSATIPAGSTADEVKQLLDTMNGGSGIYSGGPCDVVGNPGGPWFITVGDVGAIALPTVGGSDLQPASLVSVIETVAGTPLVRPQFVLRAFQQPLAYQDQWVVNGDQVEGILNLGTEGIYRVLPEGVSSHQTHFEIELTDAGGFIQTVVQVPARIQGEVIGLGAGGTNDFSAFLTLATANNLFTLRDGSNLTDPDQWRSALEVLSETETRMAISQRQLANALVLRGSGYAWIADDPALRPGTSSMGIVLLIDPQSPENDAPFIAKGSLRFTTNSIGGHWALGWTTASGGYPIYRERNNSGLLVNSQGGITLNPPEGQFLLTLARDTEAGELRMYYNDQLAGTMTGITFETLDTTAPMTIGVGVNNSRNPTLDYVANGNYRWAALLNFAPTDAEVIELYRSGVPFKHRRGAFQASTAGTLEFGQEYEIVTYEAGDDFTNVGADSNATGERFTATGTTPTTWTNGSAVKRLGAVINLQPEGIGAEKGQWLDSANGHHALMSVAGAYPLRQPEEYTLKFGPVDLTADVSLGGARDVIADGYDVVRVQHQNEDGSAAEDVTLSYDDGSTQTQFFAGASSVSAGAGEIGYPTITKPAGDNRIVAGATTAGASTFTLTLKRRQ